MVYQPQPIKGAGPTVEPGPQGTYIAKFSVPAGKGFTVQAMQGRDEQMSLTLWINNSGIWAMAQNPLWITSKVWATMYDVPVDPAARICGISGHWVNNSNPAWYEVAFNHLEYRDADDLGYDGFIWTGNPGSEDWNSAYQIRFVDGP